MSGKQITGQPNSKTRYLTFVFKYEDCSRVSYDTLNNFICHILTAANNYNECNRPYPSSSRYNIDKVFSSIDNPELDENIEEREINSL